MVAAIHRKLLRDLALLRGQVITIALIVASGVASYVALQSTWTSLQLSKVSYYRDYRFGDVFVHLKRAPESVSERIEAIPGVAQVYTRVVENVRLPLADEEQPPIGQIVSIRAGHEEPLDAVHLRSGRMPDPGHSDEVLLLEKFAKNHHLAPGDPLPVVINGTLRKLRIVGTAASPEFIYYMPPSGLSMDESRFAAIWMDRKAVSPAFQMEGAFNDVVLRLQRGASRPEVLDRLDRLLEPYGTFGAIGRDKQMSEYILNAEMQQLENMATVVPLIFLGVAAFVLNVVLARLVHLQRSQIASLKALGYSNAAVGLHYLLMVSVIVLFGSALGIALGAWLGTLLTGLYASIFGFPVLSYRLETHTAAAAALISLAAGVVGAMASVHHVASLPPAEAMQPPPPGIYHRTLLERMGLHRLVGPTERMILREIERRPLRTLLSALGIAMAVGILVVGRFKVDAVDYLLDVQFRHAMRDNLSADFTDPVPQRVVHEIAKLPGVERAEGLRSVPVRIRAGHLARDAVVNGYPDGMQLRRVLDSHGRVAPLPADGVLLTKKLGELLGVHAGDTVTIEKREGNREHYRVHVSGLVDEMFGLQAHMRLSALSRLFDEEPAVSSVALSVDPSRLENVEERLQQMPRVASVNSKAAVVEHIQEQMDETVVFTTLILTLFAATIAVGVVYNNARIAVSMRSRDLASLRVLGFTRAEISAILLGEMAVQVVLAIPIGLLVGTWLSHGIASTVDPERFRLPVVISLKTYASAILVTFVAALGSALLVRRHLDQLDLIGVLKTRE